MDKPARPDDWAGRVAGGQLALDTAVADLNDRYIPEMIDWVEHRSDTILAAAVLDDVVIPASSEGRIMTVNTDNNASVSPATIAALFTAPLATGTADAVEIATPLADGDLADGQHLTFRPSADNTGAVTISINGETARAATTPDGTALPAFYLIAGRPTEIYRDGTAYRVKRPPLSGFVSGRGYWQAHEDGTLLQWNGSTTHDGGNSHTLTFPIPFVDTDYSVQGAPIFDLNTRTFQVASRTASSCELLFFSQSDSTVTPNFQWSAVGRWY